MYTVRSISARVIPVWHQYTHGSLKNGCLVADEAVHYSAERPGQWQSNVDLLATHLCLSLQPCKPYNSRMKPLPLRQVQQRHIKRPIIFCKLVLIAFIGHQVIFSCKMLRLYVNRSCEKQ